MVEKQSLVFAIDKYLSVYDMNKLLKNVPLNPFNFYIIEPIRLWIRFIYDEGFFFILNQILNETRRETHHINQLRERHKKESSPSVQHSQLPM